MPHTLKIFYEYLGKAVVVYIEYVERNVYRYYLYVAYSSVLNSNTELPLIFDYWIPSL